MTDPALEAELDARRRAILRRFMLFAAPGGALLVGGVLLGAALEAISGPAMIAMVIAGFGLDLWGVREVLRGVAAMKRDFAGRA